MKNTTPNQKQHANTSILKSIKGKLILLGIVSIASTITLGITGIKLMNSNNANNQVLADINKINLLQNENQTQETSFLYDLDMTHYQTILTNLDSMAQAAESAKDYSSSAFYDNLSSISDSIATLKENSATLSQNLEARGFQDSDGLYADILADDAALSDCFSQMSSESDWVDAPWVDIPLTSLETENIDGVDYAKYTYSHEMNPMGKRNYFVVRFGNNSILYTGTIYITNIKFDGNIDLDLSTLTADDLSKSYGEALTNLSVGTFNGEPCISFDAAFSDATDNWTEASIEIPFSSYDLQNYTGFSYDVYFETTQMPVIKLAAAFNEKYNFTDNLATANSLFHEYSKMVAEGNDASSTLESCQNLLTEIKTNINIYTKNDDIISSGNTAIDKKLAALEQIAAYDTEILSIKQQNNNLTNSLTSVTSEVRQQIEDDTEASRTYMTALIAGVFLVSVILVGFLTVFVIASVQKSIRGFEKTLKLISDGDMTAKASINKRDEFAVFGKSLNQMTDKLTSVLNSVINVSQEVNSSGGKLKDMAESTSQTSSQIDLSISGIAQGASAQAEDVEQSTSKITDLGYLMDTMVHDITELDNTASNMKEAGDEALSILNALSHSNENMTEGIHKISDQISTTNDSVKKIEEAVSLISSIASQTNLLSLNASIEAARAGEAGRGFAVVASEIQQLAEQSNRSADTIYQVISNLTKEFRETMNVMDEVQSATNDQNQKLNETKEQFGIVNNGISQSKEKAALLKESVDACNEVCLTVSQLMMNLSAISEENAASTTETATSMQILNETISELLRESEKLMDISSQLESEIRFFKV